MFFKTIKNIELYNLGLWAVVNNAGITGQIGQTEWMTTDHFRQCNEVNLYGMIAVNKRFLPLVREAKGRIVNMTSMVGRVALANSAPYAVSKYGAEAYSDILRYIFLPKFFRDMPWYSIWANSRVGE